MANVGMTTYDMSYVAAKIGNFGSPISPFQMYIKQTNGLSWVRGSGRQPLTCQRLSAVRDPLVSLSRAGDPTPHIAAARAAIRGATSSAEEASA